MSRACFIVVLFLAVWSRAFAAEPNPIVTLKVGEHEILSEVAATPKAARVGLAFRAGLPDDGAMLFRYSGKTPRCLWMKDTLIPLTVAFLEADGRIINLIDMKPNTTNMHCAWRANWALEMNSGWFARRGVKRGDYIEGLSAAEALTGDKH